MGVGETMLVDPLEVAEQAEVGSGEFGCGWWDIRTTLAEPGRQWVELLEGVPPKAIALCESLQEQRVRADTSVGCASLSLRHSTR